MNFRSHSLMAGSLVLLSAFTMSAASAADKGAYVGVAVGQSKFDLGDTSTAGLPVKLNAEESDTGMSFVIGYRFNPYFSVEGGYNDFGKATMNADGSFSVSNVLITKTEAYIESKGSSLSASLAIPARNWDFGVRLGAYFANTKLGVKVQGHTTTSPVQNMDFSQEESASTVETMASLFAGVTFAEHYRLSLEWTRIPDVGDKEKTGEGDVTMLAAGLQYRF
jgi:OmpA-OmpF porin, OOP family